jgi:hypothetical protein
MHADVRMKAITVGEGALRVLVVHVAITCDECGSHDLIFAGHHVRPIVELLQELLAQEPALTAGGDIREGARRAYVICPENN